MSMQDWQAYREALITRVREFAKLIPPKV